MCAAYELSMDHFGAEKSVIRYEVAIFMFRIFWLSQTSQKARCKAIGRNDNSQRDGRLDDKITGEKGPN